MADEPTTDVTNSEPATPTGDAATTATTTSTTEQTDGSQSPPQGDADPLASAGLLAGDAPAEGGEEGAGEAGADDAGEGDPAAAGEALIGAPEGDYEAPEGIDPEALAEFAPLAKELNLSQTGLAKLAETGIPLVVAQAQKAMVNDVVATRKAWETDARAYVMGGKLSDGTEVQANPAFGGEAMETVMAASAKAIDRFTAPNGQPLMFPNAKVNAETGAREEGTFRDFLATTGLGNHPAMVFLTYMAGSAISEDSDFGRSGAVVHSKTSREAKYYPHHQT